MHAKLFALVTAVSFGVNPVLLRRGFVRKGRPDVAVVVGLAVTIPVYLLISPFVGGITFRHFTWAAWIGFILGGLFGGGIGRRWMFVAIDLIGASRASAIKNSAPLITTALGIAVLGEPVTLIRWVAIFLIVGGVVLLTWQGEERRRWYLSAGVVAALGSALSYGVRPLFLKYGLNAVHAPLTGALVGIVVALVYASWLTPKRELWQGLRGPGIGLFAFSGVLQAIGFLALTYGLSKGDVSVVYPITSSAPLFTILFTAVMLRRTERLTWRIVLGGCAIVAGVIKL